MVLTLIPLESNIMGSIGKLLLILSHIYRDEDSKEQDFEAEGGFSDRTIENLKLFIAFNRDHLIDREAVK